MVLEKSSQDEIDVNAQCNAVLHNLLRQLKTSPETIPLTQWKAERIEMNTGNEMLDQLQPYYFGVAFFFHLQLLHRYAGSSCFHAKTKT